MNRGAEILHKEICARLDKIIGLLEKKDNRLKYNENPIWCFGKIIGNRNKVINET